MFVPDRREHSCAHGYLPRVCGVRDKNWKAMLSPILRHCERSEAIQTASAVGFWIASLRSQLCKFTNSLIEFILCREDSDARQHLRPDHRAELHSEMAILDRGV